MRKILIACFVFLTVEGAFSATPVWRVMDTVSGRGGAIAISGDYFAVGLWDGFSIYRKERNDWVLDHEVEEIGAGFGEWLSLSDGVYAVGSPHDVSTLLVGRVFMYRLTDGEWIIEQILSDPHSRPYYCFGHEVDVDGDVLAVTSSCLGGMECEEQNSSELHLYRFDGEQWQFEQAIPEGWGGKVRGDRCVLIRWVFRGTGYTEKLFSYRFDGTVWIEEKEFDFPHGIFQWNFGFNGDHLAVADVDSGQTRENAVYIYAFDGSDWVEEAKLISPGYDDENIFGCEIVLHDNVCVVGSLANDPQDNAAYVYESSDGVWTLTAKFDRWVDELQFGDFNYHGESPGKGLASDGKHIIVMSYSSNYNPSIFAFGKCPAMDLNGDCFVTVADLQVIAEQWLTGHR